MIQIHDLAFQYRSGDFRLRISELSIGRASTVAIIGPSGTGKTTLLNLIAGIAVPQAGQVVTNEVSLSGLDDAARHCTNIGAPVPANFSFVANTTERDTDKFTPDCARDRFAQ